LKTYEAMFLVDPAQALDWKKSKERSDA